MVSVPDHVTARIFTLSPSIRLLIWIFDMVLHRVAQTFCLDISRYEVKVYASVSKMAFVKNCSYTLSQSFTFSAAPSVCAAVVSSLLFSLLSHLLNTDETMVTHKLSFVRPELS